MSGTRRMVSLALTLVSLAAYAQENEAWRARPIAEWTEDDARQVLTNSPWVKTFTPDIKPAQSNGGGGRGMGRGGMNVGGIGIGMPGIPGMGRRGMGIPGVGNAGGQSRQGEPDSGQAPQLTLRWESALPVNAAELKLRDTGAPEVEEKYYALVVYGVPDRMAVGDPDRLASEFKKDASIKRQGKKDIKPANVEVLRRENGTAVVFLFSRSNEITREDRRVEFNAEIGRLKIIESFFTDDMVWQGKTEF